MIKGEDIKKFKELEKRYNELTEILAHSDVVQNPKLIQKYGKEQKELQEVVGLWKRYEKLEHELKKLTNMLREEKDEEIKELLERKKIVLNENLLFWRKSYFFSFFPEINFLIETPWLK